jgi:hypothetical protein
MADEPQISIVFGYRNRDVARIKHCLESLVSQTYRDFEVVFVDYGSGSGYQSQIRPLVDSYDFCRYLYSETQGYPWNRSHALNTGARKSRGTYILMNDVDMVFGDEFVAGFAGHARLDQVLYTSPYRLPRGFSDWDHLSDYHDALPRFKPGGRGISLIPADVFKELHGYDEFYRYYGAEDNDLYQRLIRYGSTARWVTEDTPAYHQWHPEVSYRTQGVFPAGVWERMRVHLYANKNRIVRNTENWGGIHSLETRPVFGFVDPDTCQLIPRPDMHTLDKLLVTNPNTTARFIRTFFEDIPPGHALVVPGADFPDRPRWLNMLILHMNGLLHRLGYNTRVDYSNNLLHDTLIYLIEQAPDSVTDYFLNANGVSVLVKS